MPQVQVLDRQDDPLVKQIAAGGQGIAEAIKYRQAVELTKQELAMKLKNTTSEEEKQRLEKLKFVGDTIDKAKEANNPTVSGALLRIAADAGFGGDQAKMFEHFGEYADLVDKNKAFFEPSPDEKALKDAKLQESLASARKNRAEAGINEAVLPSIQQSLGQTPEQSPQPGSSQPAEPTGVGGGGGAGFEDNSPQPMSSGMQKPNFTLTGINVGGLTLTDQQAQARAAALNAGATAQANQEVTNAPIRQAVTSYIDQFERAKAEIGGLGDTAAAAYTKGFFKNVESNFGKLHELQALNQMTDATAIEIGSYINHGRPTEPDAKAGKNLLPSISYPEATNQALTRHLSKVMKLATNDNPPGKGQRNRSYESYLTQGKAILDYNKKAVAAMKAAHPDATDDEINQALEILNQKQGF